MCDNQISTQLKQKTYPPSKSGSKDPYVGPHAEKLRKLGGAGFAGLQSGTGNKFYTTRDVPASTKMAHHFHDEPVLDIT